MTRYIVTRLGRRGDDGGARNARHLSDRQYRSRRSGAGAARRSRGVEQGIPRLLAREIRPRSAALRALFHFPERPVPGRSRHLDRDAAPGARRYRAICAGNHRACDRGISDLGRHRHSARRHRGGAARQLDRQCRAFHFAHRRVVADVLARLHHARDLLRRAADRARTRPARRDRVSAGENHRAVSGRQHHQRRLGDVQGCGGPSVLALDRARARRRSA